MPCFYTFCKELLTIYYTFCKELLVIYYTFCKELLTIYYTFCKELLVIYYTFCKELYDSPTHTVISPPRIALLCTSSTGGLLRLGTA